MYGPFTKDGEHNSEGNVAFDKSLRSQNSSWGIRDIRDLEAEPKSTTSSSKASAP